MRRRLIAICLTLTAAFSLALVPAAFAAKKKQAKAPTISRVLPMRLGVGEKLTIRGNNFSVKRKRNTVIFRAPSGRTAFAKPTTASKTKLVVTVPGAVTRLLAKSSASSKPTRFTLRVLSGTFSKFTTKRLSPVIVGPGSGGKGGTDGGPGSPGAVACKGTDSDGDLLPNSVELELKTDPCLKDTD
ncbi:MAG TPA: IPT/TIG domain-containing protein, partial [Thermoleophilaceae bacterium]